MPRVDYIRIVAPIVTVERVRDSNGLLCRRLYQYAGAHQLTQTTIHPDKLRRLYEMAR